MVSYIRKATEKDIPSLLVLAQDGIDGCGIEETNIEPEWLTMRWKDVISHPELAWNAVVDVDGIVDGYSHGFLGSQWHVSKPMAYLSTMYIRPHTRSIRLFNEMVDGFIHWAKVMNAEAAWACLTNSMDGPTLERLWRQRGFHSAGRMFERYL